ncbi:ZIP family metal transporter [soil metagenome]
MNIWFAALLSVSGISLLSFVGIVGIGIKSEKLKRIIIPLVSFAAGALLGDVFIHLLPEVAQETGFSIYTSLYVLFGIVVSFIMEKVVAWRHCHTPLAKGHVHRFAYMNLIGDGLHNFIDGLIIGSSYLVSMPVGIASTVAIILHEIPQEIGDFGILIHGGFSKKKAIIYNFLTGLTAIVGTVLALLISNSVSNMTHFLMPFAAGSFIYIAGADLIPELHKDESTKSGIIQTIAFVIGILVMMSLLLLER